MKTNYIQSKTKTKNKSKGQRSKELYGGNFLPTLNKQTKCVFTNCGLQVQNSFKNLRPYVLQIRKIFLINAPEANPPQNMYNDEKVWILSALLRFFCVIHPPQQQVVLICKTFFICWVLAGNWLYKNRKMWSQNKNSLQPVAEMALVNRSEQWKWRPVWKQKVSAVLPCQLFVHGSLLVLFTTNISMVVTEWKMWRMWV